MKPVIDWRKWMPLSEAAVALGEIPPVVFQRVVSHEIKGERLTAARRSRWILWRADVEKVVAKKQRATEQRAQHGA